MLRPRFFKLFFLDEPASVTKNIDYEPLPFQTKDENSSGKNSSAETSAYSTILDITAACDKDQSEYQSLGRKRPTVSTSDDGYCESTSSFPDSGEKLLPTPQPH